MHSTLFAAVLAMQDRLIIRINHYSALTSAVDPRPAILLPETCPFSREQNMTHLQPQRRLPRMWQRCLRCKIDRSEEHTSELQSLMRISYAVFCLKKKKNKTDIDVF